MNNQRDNYWIERYGDPTNKKPGTIYKKVPSFQKFWEFIVKEHFNEDLNQIIDKDNVLEFRKKVNEKLLSFIKENLPSLAESDKSLPPNDWIN